MPRCQFEEMQHQVLPTEQESFFVSLGVSAPNLNNWLLPLQLGTSVSFPLINQQHVAKVNCSGQNTSPCVEGGHVWLAFFNALNLESI